MLESNFATRESNAHSDPRENSTLAVSVFGLGYVGTVSCACLAELGHQVTGVDIQQEKVDAMNLGQSTLIEPELDQLLESSLAEKRLNATSDAAAAVKQSDISLICVGTPSDQTGCVDMEYVRAVCRQIGGGLSDKTGRHVVAIRSTIPPGSVDEVVIPALESASGRIAGQDFGVCTNPEFLREGSAVADFRRPPMIVIGQSHDVDGDVVAALYQSQAAPVHRLSPDEAMMVKYASNAYHAAKVVFANEIGLLCGSQGLDSQKVMKVFAEDRQLNISAKYLRPGFAFGGSCLPKDVRGLLSIARSNHESVPLLESLLPSNSQLVDRAVRVIMSTTPRKVGILGLSFKAQTDDMRESPIVETVERLIGKGVDIAVYDPDVRVSRLFGGNLTEVERRLPHLADLLRDDLNEVIAHGEIVVIAKPCEAFSVALKACTSSQRIVDLVHLFQSGEIPNLQYESLTG